MYSFETMFEGVRYTVFLFSSFTGIVQPFLPEDPITAEEIYDYIDKYSATNYVQAWYVETKDGPRLDMLKKVFLLAEPFDKSSLPKAAIGSHYYRLYKDGDQIKVGGAITALDAINEVHYLRFVVNDQGEVDSSLHIYNNAYDLNKYTYDERGVLIDRKVEIKKEPEKIPDL